MMKLNTVTQLLVLIVLAVLVNFLSIKALLALLLLLLCFIFMGKHQAAYLKAILRFKWFFIFMFAIFAFNTAGEHLRGWPFSISPTYEGLNSAATHVLKILIILTSLSLIMANNSKQQLISGLYYMLSPLQHLGIKIERFAARLWLTLHYVEQQNNTNKKRKFTHFMQQIAEPANTQVDDEMSIELTMPHFVMVDFIAIVMLLMAIVLLVWLP